MGIVNVTPDSFSGRGGGFFDVGAAVAHGTRTRLPGVRTCSILGGESTRPNAEAVCEVEEVRRVLPVVEKLRDQVDVPLSIDTSKPIVARRSDGRRGGNHQRRDGADRPPAMIEIASQSKAAVCVMHMLGTPRTMQDDPVYDDVVGEVLGFLVDVATLS